MNLTPEQVMTIRGAVLVDRALTALKHATLGRCDGTIADCSLGHWRRCRSMGVLIAAGYRCPQHGYERGVTPLVTDDGTPQTTPPQPPG